MFKNFVRSNYIILLAHLSVWGVFFILPFIMVNKDPMPSSFIKEIPLTGVMVFSMLIMGVFYVNYYVILPRFLSRFKFGYLLMLWLAMWIFVMLILAGVRVYFTGTSFHLPPFTTFFPFLLIIMMSLSIRLIADRYAEDRQIKERENETLKSELAFLRSQISPHFLFNIMNNVVALSRIEPQKVEPTLIQLSQLMRYMLYNSDEKKVPISKEIEYLESYIDLQKLRFGDTIEVIFNKNKETSTPNPQSPILTIEPMLLIPFVENAFKHGTGFIEKPTIEINLNIDNNTLIFNVLNKYNPLSKETKDKDSGIGLKNVSRRLDLLYGSNHSLIIDKTDAFFKVNLNLKLDKP
jgi:sensor histidine kinase YesM